MKSSSRSKARVITVKVTQKNIDTATKILSQPARCNACPVAQAFIDTKKFKTVGVFITFASLRSEQGKAYVVSLPVKVQQFIKRYDGEFKVKPFQFTARLLAD